MLKLAFHVYLLSETIGPPVETGPGVVKSACRECIYCWLDPKLFPLTIMISSLKNNGFKNSYLST